MTACTKLNNNSFQTIHILLECFAEMLASRLILAISLGLKAIQVHFMEVLALVLAYTSLAVALILAFGDMVLITSLVLCTMTSVSVCYCAITFIILLCNCGLTIDTVIIFNKIYLPVFFIHSYHKGCCNKKAK